MLNLMLSRNWVRGVFPLIPAFCFVYMFSPVIHGNVNIMHYQNYSFDTVYYKYASNRMPMVENTITRIA